MNLHIKKSLTIFIVFIFFIIFIYYGQAYLHENAHRAIAKNHYCNEYEISYFAFPNPYFKCLNYSQQYYENSTIRLQEEVLHSMNEIVTYNLSVVIISLFACTSIISCTIILFSNK